MKIQYDYKTMDQDCLVSTTLQKGGEINGDNFPENHLNHTIIKGLEQPI